MPGDARRNADVSFPPIADICGADDNLGMRWRFLPLVLAVAACGTRNTFVVEDPKGLVRTATLEICGSQTPLKRDGSKLTLTQRVHCQEGEIRLVYQDGGPEHCPIGYIDSVEEQQWHFRADREGCLLIG
jgi:hypothetical protein